MEKNTDTPPSWYLEFMEKYPEVGKQYQALGDAVHNAGPLNERERALIKLAISGSSRLKAAFNSHVRRARSLGISKEEMEHVAILALPTIGFPGMMRLLYWIEDGFAEDAE